jgi:hypothetical protein
LVATVNRCEPATDSSAAACPVTRPVAADVKTIVHCPFVSVFAPASSHVLAAGSTTATAPFESMSTKPTCSPAAGLKPAPSPSSFCNVTVKLCACPTRFAALGAIAIFAFTHRFVTGPEFDPVPSVFRISVTPPTATVVCALTVDTPVVVELNATLQEPVPPDVVQVVGVTVPGPLSTVKLIDVPSGAFMKPEPSFTFTCAVNVCAWPTGLTPFGVIEMFASSFCADAELTQRKSTTKHIPATARQPTPVCMLATSPWRVDPSDGTLLG